MPSIKLSERLESERLLLRIPEATFENAQIQFKTTDRNRAHVGKWLNWVEKTQKPEDCFGFLNHVQESFTAGEKAGYWIIEKSTGDFCGMCSAALHTDEQEYASIGYWLDISKCKKGYITEAVKMIEDNLFPQGLVRMEIRNDIENIPSANIPKKLEYHLDGILRQASTSSYFKTPRDINVWSKIASEYQAPRF